MVLLDLHSHLAGDTGLAAESGGSITEVRALIVKNRVKCRDNCPTPAQPYLDVVFLPGLVPQDEGGDAGQPAAEETTENSILVETLGILVSLARQAESSTAT